MASRCRRKPQRLLGMLCLLSSVATQLSERPSWLRRGCRGQVRFTHLHLQCYVRLRCHQPNNIRIQRHGHHSAGHDDSRGASSVLWWVYSPGVRHLQLCRSLHGRLDLHPLAVQRPRYLLSELQRLRGAKSLPAAAMPIVRMAGPRYVR